MYDSHDDPTIAMMDKIIFTTEVEGSIHFLFATQKEMTSSLLQHFMTTLYVRHRIEINGNSRDEDGI